MLKILLFLLPFAALGQDTTSYFTKDPNCTPFDKYAHYNERGEVDGYVIKWANPDSVPYVSYAISPNDSMFMQMRSNGKILVRVGAQNTVVQDSTNLLMQVVVEYANGQANWEHEVAALLSYYEKMCGKAYIVRTKKGILIRKTPPKKH